MILKAKGLASERARRRMIELFAARGVEASRLDLRSSAASLAEHFAMYREIDVALDTFPYCGTTTTCEALWMGVPVVTLAGERHASRVGASLLGCAGLGELIARDADDFLRIATSAVGRTARAELRDQVQSSPLMDARRFTRELEDVYRMMWRDYCGGAA
jgi:predicted O-linked N-acetylglucosamine transferase (SPINDLY family)